MSDTSRLSWHQLIRSGRLQGLKLDVLTTMARMGVDFATAREICHIGDIDQGWKRFSELERDGLIVRLKEKKQCTITGRKATLWALRKGMNANSD